MYYNTDNHNDNYIMFMLILCNQKKKTHDKKQFVIQLPAYDNRYIYYANNSKYIFSFLSFF